MGISNPTNCLLIHRLMVLIHLLQFSYHEVSWYILQFHSSLLSIFIYFCMSFSLYNCFETSVLLVYFANSFFSRFALQLGRLQALWYLKSVASLLQLEENSLQSKKLLNALEATFLCNAIEATFVILVLLPERSSQFFGCRCHERIL